MSISPFFLELRSGYQSEMDDLTSDSEGKDVLRQRLAEKRKQIDFLVQMMELSPEMVAPVFNRAFTFRLPAVMDQLLSQEADEFADWATFTDAIEVAPWAQGMVERVLREPRGDWFMTVAAGLEYMAGLRHLPRVAAGDDDEDGDGDGEGKGRDRDEEDEDDNGNGELIFDENDEERVGRARREAADDWMAEQGFDRKGD